MIYDYNTFFMQVEKVTQYLYLQSSERPSGHSRQQDQPALLDTFVLRQSTERRGTSLADQAGWLLPLRQHSWRLLVGLLHFSPRRQALRAYRQQLPASRWQNIEHLVFTVTLKMFRVQETRIWVTFYDGWEIF